MNSKKPSVIIFGAGVIGLQTGIRLLEQGYNVLIIAQHLPGDTSIEYTSPWAGAQWRSHSTSDDIEQQSWDKLTYLKWKETCFREHATNVAMEDRTGLTMYPARLLYDSQSHQDLQPTGDPDSSNGFWFREFVDSFQATNPPPKGYAAAVKYNSIFVDVPMYLDHLRQSFEKTGGRIIRHKLQVGRGLRDAIDEATKLVERQLGENEAANSVFVNATGIGARALCGDEAVFPVRGQVLLVKGTAKEAVSRIGRDVTANEDFVAYIIPRPLSGVTVIGGCRQEENWNAEEDPEITQHITRRCAPLAPELLTGPGGTFEILGCQVGLRPARKGGARIERENVMDGRRRKRVVVHAYGNGGAGFQNSIGVANKVLRLLEKENNSANAKL